VINFNIMNEADGATTWVDDKNVADELKKFEGYHDLLQDGKYSYYVNLYALEDESLKTYTKIVGADYEKIRNGFNAIVVDTIPYEDAQAGKYVETKVISAKIGEKIDLLVHDWE